MKSYAYVLNECEGDVSITADDGTEWEVSEQRNGLKIAARSPAADGPCRLVVTACVDGHVILEMVPFRDAL